ncbi:MAG: J domain-containing protein [Dehalococcoidia bacterium]|nr:J domain-containing protein [Dehalococcoidia bacterium]
MGDFRKKAYSGCTQCGGRFYWFRGTQGVSYRVDSDSIDWGSIEWVPEDANYDVPRFQRSKGHVEHACGAEDFRARERKERGGRPRGERRTHIPPPPQDRSPPPRSRRPQEDPFAVLGVLPSAPPDEIRKAYRKLAFTHHPDKGGSEDRMKRINAAYDAVTAGRR